MMGMLTGIPYSSHAHVGAFLWGFISDKYGRKTPFLLTLCVAAIFGILSSLSMTISLFCVLLYAMGVGVGGSLPTDGSLFLEFVPMKQSMLVLMSLFWPAGQVFASVLGWIFMSNDSICRHDCHPVSRFDGWRGVILSVGLATAVMAAIRVFFFRMIESPKFLYYLFTYMQTQEWAKVGCV